MGMRSGNDNEAPRSKQCILANANKILHENALSPVWLLLDE
jgi:hypothetical protein